MRREMMKKTFWERKTPERVVFVARISELGLIILLPHFGCWYAEHGLSCIPTTASAAGKTSSYQQHKKFFILPFKSNQQSCNRKPSTFFTGCLLFYLRHS
jgi:hypothetical protein